MNIENSIIKKQNQDFTILIWKMAIGSVLSWEIAKLLGSDHPYLAPLTVILCIQATMQKSMLLSIKRVIGTIIGILVILIIASKMSINGWNLGLLILIGCYISKWLKLDRIIIHQTALTILFVFVFEHQSKDYALDRMTDTLVGVVVTVLIQIIWFRFFSKNKKQVPIT